RMRLHGSACRRGGHRILKVSRPLANLEGREEIESNQRERGDSVPDARSELLGLNVCQHVKPHPGFMQRHFNRRSSPRTTEKQNIAVGVLELETAQTVISVFQWLGKLDIARSKFGRQCVRIRDVNERVPAGDTFFDISLVVRQGSYANVFEQDLRSAPA